MSPSPKLKKTAAAIFALLGSSALFNAADAANAEFDFATNILSISAVDVPNSASHVNAPTFNAKLKLVQTEPFIKLELSEASQIATPNNTDRSHFDPVFGQVYLPSINVGGTEFSAIMKLMPGSDPMAFQVTNLHEKTFTGCPSFAPASPNVSGACVLEGTYNQNITLTNNTTWIISGGVFIGDDRAGSATVTIEPGTRLVGRSGLDFLYIRRNSQIQAIGTPQHPIVMTGPNEQLPGEWGGLVLAGNAPANGCSEGTAVCEQRDEALTTPYGGNRPNDNSGVLKYVSLRFAGKEVRPDEELNCLTMLGVGNGTTVDFVQCHMGSDDGFEMFGGTVNMKHLVATKNDDDGFDWQIGWQGKAQYVLAMSLPDGSDAGIEADNNQQNHTSSPRSNGKLSNFTLIGSGSGADGHGIVLRRGTSANIYNTVITGYGRSCMTLDNPATYNHAGMPGNLTGTLTMRNSHVQCGLNFNDRTDMPFLVSAWFNSQQGNVAGNVQLNGYLPAAGSPQLTGGAPVPNDAFFDAVTYVGAFANENDNWTKGWTIGLD